MAFYCVRYEGRYYANRELAKTILCVGDSGLVHAVVSGRTKATVILESVVYEIPSIEILKGLQCNIRQQDIDAQLKAIHAAAKTEGASHSIEELMPRAVAMLDGMSFVPFRSVAVDDKYRWILRRPHLEFLGKKYVPVSEIGKE